MMIDTLQYILLGLALFGLPALILAMAIRRRNGRRSSVLSILQSETASTPDQDGFSQTRVPMRARENKAVPRTLVGVLVFSALSFQAVMAQTQEPLKDKENPLLIGQREINKHQINFHSLEREIALG